MSGWFKFYRSIREHWIYRDAEHLKVWVEMLALARHSDEPGTDIIEGQLVEIGYAEFIFGRKKWSTRLGISEQRLRTLIKKMIDDDMIEVVKTFSKFTLYRVKNYHVFNQHDNHQNNQMNNQQDNQQKTAIPLGESENNNQQNNQESNQHDNQHINRTATSKQPADNQQVTTIEECKERKNVKKEKKKVIKTKYAEFVNMTEEEYNNLIAAHGEERTKRMISVLNNYKGAKGKTYKNDYMAILSWVVERVADDERKANAQIMTTGKPRPGNYGRREKPALPIVERVEQQVSMSPEELEKARNLAARLDGGS